MKKIITLAICTIFIMVMLCGCGDTATSKEYAIDDSMNYSAEELSEDSLSDASSKDKALDSRKLIKEFSLSIETKDYDNYITGVRNNVASSGGYIENSNESSYSKLRSFTAVIRIPVGKAEGFTKSVSKDVTVVEKSENVEDVTEQYVDVEARIKVFKAEEESLIEIMKKASNVKDLLSVKERLADVRAQIESYTAQLKSLQNQTAYSTINLTVEEVEREVQKEGYWSGIWNNIIKGFKNVWTIITSLFAFLISAIPYLILISVVAVIIIILVRYFKKRKSNKK
ncbi:MAG: DUF4349 domain-containing protein [Ruminococcaceae bacterium]|nr:DUF4349 domain-containing protein [Oscillospiraceae bacterium]